LYRDCLGVLALQLEFRGLGVLEFYILIPPQLLYTNAFLSPAVLLHIRPVHWLMAHGPWLMGLWNCGLIVASFSSENPTPSSASSLTCRRQLTHFHLHPHLSLYDDKTGKPEIGFLYLILSFFESVSSSSSLEMSSAKLIKSLLTAKIGLMARDGSSVGSFLWMVAGTSSFGARGVGVGLGVGLGAILDVTLGVGLDIGFLE
jgi:hypothetical protein